MYTTLTANIQLGIFNGKPTYCVTGLRGKLFYVRMQDARRCQCADYRTGGVCTHIALVASHYVNNFA